MTVSNGQTPQDLPFTGNEEITENALDVSNMVANEFIQNAIFSRFQSLVRGFNRERSIDNECGYPLSLDAYTYRDMYDRDSLAARVVQVLPKESWQIQPKIYEDEDPDKETEFEKGWMDLHKQLRGESWYQDEEGSPIWDYLIRADILSGIGHYGVLLLGLDDGRPLDMPLEEYQTQDGQPAGTEGLYGPNPLRGDTQGYDTYTTKAIALDKDGKEGNEVQVPGYVFKEAGKKSGKGKAGRKLTFLKVFDETLAQITRYERDPNNPRFGLPQMYLLTFNDPRHDPSGGAGLPVASAHCHWSRVIHIADNLGSNDVLGYPRMKQVFNRLYDAYKVYGAAGEGFWQQCFAMLSLETNPALGADFKIDSDAIRKQLSNLKERLQRHLVLAGMTAKTLPPNVTDPTPFIGVFIEAICIFLGCPVRVFKGSERGELASSQDDSSWNDRLRHRQLFYITPKILVPFIDRLIKVGVLPEPEGYSVMWDDLESLSDKDKAAIALQLTQAISAYIAGGCEKIMPVIVFLTEVLKIPHNLAVEIVEQAQADAEAEEQMTIMTPEEQQEQTDAQVPTEQGDPEDSMTAPEEIDE